ncbi:MAG TPA: hypothetical protein VM262_00500 [Acidimicrobiales bacterium]|nr:hypothetical protein [Acidimicrobiales bacterium]
MVIVFVVLIAVLIFVIAAVAVGRETSRLAAQPPRPVFDMDEAVEWIADRLPPEVTAELSHDDVRQILQWSLDQLAVRPDDEVLVVDDEALAYVQVRAREAGRDWTESQIQHVLDVQLAYLQAIGAAGAEREI